MLVVEEKLPHALILCPGCSRIRCSIHATITKYISPGMLPTACDTDLMTGMKMPEAAIQ
jgi:LSD1 subclass zinc finger protein